MSNYREPGVVARPAVKFMRLRRGVNEISESIAEHLQSLIDSGVPWESIKVSASEKDGVMDETGEKAWSALILWLEYKEDGQ